MNRAHQLEIDVAQQLVLAAKVMGFIKPNQRQCPCLGQPDDFA
jgi:hypothetical protein